jgi:hypothetical protein
MGSLILLYQAGDGCISGMYSKDKSAHDYEVYNPDGPDEQYRVN